MIGRRTAVAVAVVGVASTLSGCGGSDDGAPAEAAFPTTAAVGTGPLTAEVTDAAGDSGDRLVDVRAARIEQRGTTLVVRVTLAGPAPRTRAGHDPVQVGAYLLRDPDDAEPYAARAVLDPPRPPAYRWGPWLAAGAAAAGTVTGAEITVTVEDVPAGRYRYVQFFAESTGGADVAPDDTPDGAGVVAIDPGAS